MVANLCLVTCALIAAQSADRPEWLLSPRLSRGQELVYKGSFAEEALEPGVQFSRSYRLESRLFVMEAPSQSVQVALYTVLKLRTPRPMRGGEPEPSSVRLELVRVDSHGRLQADPKVSLTVPLEGPATVECGAFVELPRGRIGLKQSWEVLEDSRPAQSWNVVGTELLNGTRCVKLKGVQQSPDWDHPRADHTAWRREDLVWLAPNLGLAFKVERKIERRDPAHRDPTERSIAQYELQSNLQYPGRLFEDRRREIMQARGYYEAVAPLLPNPTKMGPAPFDAVLAKITHHLENEPPTPYREAVLQVKRRVEAAKRGESPPSLSQEGAGLTTNGLSVGQRAPEFISTNLLTKEPVRSRRWLGRPILMIFYSPTSMSASDALGFCQKIEETRHGSVHVAAFSVADDAARIEQQTKELHLSFPVLSGQGLRQTYGVDATPKLVVIDADGVVRGIYEGWGPETRSLVTDELNRWSKMEGRPYSSPDVKEGGAGSLPLRP
ncbi:MAG TPA: redoxin domain-containing protein [Gemmataceae bacterium]|nr:redoxin domain-containing protein [Gemmataceae bacterium]